MHQYLGLSRTGVSAFYGNLACVVPTKKLFFFTRAIMLALFQESFPKVLHHFCTVV